MLKKRREIIKATLILLALCAASAIILASLNTLLSGFEETQRAIPARAAMERVLPADDYIPLDFEAGGGVLAVYEAKTGGERVGFCVETAAPDYDGEMTALIAINNDKKVAAVEIISMPEGVGTKVKDIAYLSRFAGKSGKLTSVKAKAATETEISAVSGATASSDAVVACVNHALGAVSQISAKEAVAE